MSHYSSLSDELKERIADLIGNALPAMDGRDQRRLYKAILRIVNDEVLRAAAMAWDACCAATQDSFELAVSVHQSKVHERLTKACEN